MFNRKKNNRPLNYRRSFSNFARKQKNPLNELNDFLCGEVGVHDTPENMMMYLDDIRFNNGGSGRLYGGGRITPKMIPLAHKLYDIFSYWYAEQEGEDTDGVDFGEIPDVKATKELIKKLGALVQGAQPQSETDRYIKIFRENDWDELDRIFEEEGSSGFDDSLTLDENGGEEGDGMTPFLYAVVYASPEMVEYLLEETDADVNTRNASGYNALMVALFRGRTDLVDFLIDNGADIDDNVSGETPLIIAAQEGNLQAVKKLIEAGADPDIKGYCDYKTPLEAAEAEGHTKVVSYLKRVLGNNGRRGRGRRR